MRHFYESKLSLVGQLCNLEAGVGQTDGLLHIANKTGQFTTSVLLTGSCQTVSFNLHGNGQDKNHFHLEKQDRLQGLRLSIRLKSDAMRALNLAIKAPNARTKLLSFVACR